MDVEFDLHEIDLSDKPREFVKRSPTGKVPMIVEDDFVLYESQILNDYLVDRFGWNEAYADDLQLEYQQKVCMKQWDSIVLGPVYGSLSDPNKLDENWEDIEAELEYLSEVVQRSSRKTRSLFAYHFAPFWARFCWLDDYTAFPERVGRFPSLSKWFDRVLEEPPVSETLPDPQWARQQYEKHYAA